MPRFSRTPVVVAARPDQAPLLNPNSGEFSWEQLFQDQNQALTGIKTRGAAFSRLAMHSPALQPRDLVPLFSSPILPHLSPRGQLLSPASGGIPAEEVEAAAPSPLTITRLREGSALDALKNTPTGGVYVPLRRVSFSQRQQLLQAVGLALPSPQNSNLFSSISSNLIQACSSPRFERKRAPTGKTISSAHLTPTGSRPDIARHSNFLKNSCFPLLCKPMRSTLGFKQLRILPP